MCYLSFVKYQDLCATKNPSSRRRIDGATNTGSAFYLSVTAIAELVIAVDSDLRNLELTKPTAC